MIAAVLRTALWIGLVDALAGAAVLGFLYVPESNVLMLALSAVLVLVAAALLVVSSTSAAVGLVHQRAPWRCIGQAIRRLPLALVGIAVVGLLCAGAGGFESWWASRAGEIDAAAIAAGDVTQTRWLHTAVRWAVIVVQWILAPAWLAASLAWAAGYERRDVLSLKWLAAGLHWRLLLVTALGIVGLVWLPWGYVYWQPRGLPASSLELLFAGAKLAAIYGLSQVAWSLALWTAARRVPAPLQPPDAA